MTARLGWCFQDRDFASLTDLYSLDAVLELHVGGAHDLYHGRAAVIARYTEDYAAPATFLRWDIRGAPWGAVVEAAAVQGDGEGKMLFRWVHVLGIEAGRISTDTVYCTGAVPASGDEAPRLTEHSRQRHQHVGSKGV